MRGNDVLRAVFDHALEAILLADDFGRYIDANPAACALFGYSREEFTQLSIKDLVDDGKTSCWKQLFKEFQDKGFESGEYLLARKDGVRLTVEFRSVASIAPGVHLAVLRDISDLKVAHRDLRQANRRLNQRVARKTSRLRRRNRQLARLVFDRQQLEKELAELTVVERARIGRELHDSLGQGLSGMAMLTKSLQHRLSGSSKELSGMAGEVMGLVDETQTRIQALARRLTPLELIADGLANALHTLIMDMAFSYKIKGSCHCSDLKDVIDDVSEVHLFYIAQEALLNACIHGRPSSIESTLDWGPESVSLSIRDDGIGLEKNSRRGLGMRIMDHRARVIGGHLQIESSPGKGTTVTCLLPHKNENRSVSRTS